MAWHRPFGRNPVGSPVGYDIAGGVLTPPAPDSVATVGELGSLLAMETVPDAAPPAVGVNVTETVVVSPSSNSVSVAESSIVNPAPSTVIEEIVTVSSPMFWIVSSCVSLVPTSIAPNVREVAESAGPEITARIATSSIKKLISGVAVLVWLNERT